MNDLEMLNGEYILVEESKNHGFYMAEVRHVIKNNEGGQNQTPVGSLVAFFKSADIETYADHWSVSLYFRTDIRYLENERITVVESEAPSFIEKSLQLFGLQMVREKPLYSRKLVEDIGKVLLESNTCSEPMVMEIYHHSGGHAKFYGNIFQEDGSEDE
jgi:hypothetical protein